MSVSHSRWWRNLGSLLHETALKWYADNCTRLGASLSYYTILSLFPLILVALSIVRILFFNSDSVREVILNSLSNVTGGFRDDFDTALQAATRTRGSSGIIGSVLLLLGASWVFGELVSAFNIIWGLEAPARGGPLQFLRSTFSSFALVLAGIFLLLISLIISAVLAALGEIVVTLPGGLGLWRVLHTIFTLTVLMLVFALLLKYLPQTRVAWRDVWLGAAITTLGWSLLQVAIAQYIALSQYREYGAVGAILALVAWVYLSSQVIFFGGEFTSVYARRYGSRAQSKPAPAAFAQPITQSLGSSGPAAATRAVDRAAGVTIGVIGAIGLALIAALIGLGRALRRLLIRARR
jgi:membrane protein